MAFPHRSQGYAVVNIWLYTDERLGTDIQFLFNEMWLLQHGPARGQEMHFVSTSQGHSWRQILISNTSSTVLKQIMTSPMCSMVICLTRKLFLLHTDVKALEKLHILTHRSCMSLNDV